ncbi:MAG: hypothetical protein RBU21_02915 [FCB group bacterium]|jgi:hypothetical protein|nr:hypothetical protein [FCB group bacterium]
MTLTGLDALAYWLGYALIVLLALAATFSGITALLTMAAQPAWKTLVGVYDLYVLKWWMDAIKKSGRVIPTKKNVNETLTEIDQETK